MANEPRRHWAGVAIRTALARARVSRRTSLAFLFAAGCGNSAAPPVEPAVTALGDANNYRATATLHIPTVETVSAADVDVCWPEAVSDLQCHPVAPVTDTDNVALLRVGDLSPDEVEDQLVNGRLKQSSIDGYLDYHTDHGSTCMKLSQLSFLGTVVDVPTRYVESERYTYLLLLTRGTSLGVGAQTMTFLKPTSSSTNSHVDVAAGCGLLDFRADLHSLTAVPMRRAGPWPVDWEALTTDGLGNPVIPQKIDGLTVGFHRGKTVAELEEGIFDIESAATSLWDLELESGTSADLADAENRSTGAAFAGFDTEDEGTWLLALTCSSCQTPAPILLTIVEPKR